MQTMDTDYARHQMVTHQMRAARVSEDRLLTLFETVSRDGFVPPRFRRLAFADLELPLGHGERMMTPLVEGRLLQALALEPDDEVLEIGTGSGFLAACLAHLAARVTSVDIHEDFIAAARDRLAAAGIDNVSLVVQDACRELPPGRFDAIAVTGSLPQLDERYVDALQPGGRLFIVTGEAPAMEARLVTRGDAGEPHERSLFETCLGRLKNAGETPRFSF